MTARPLTTFSLLQEQAERDPDSPVLLVKGQQHTRGFLYTTVRSIASALQTLGLQRGDRALLMADNSVEHVACWLGINAAGLIDVPINTEAKGASLRYLTQDSTPRVAIGQRAYLERLIPAMDVAPEYIVVLDGDTGMSFPSKTQLLTYDALLDLRPDGDVPAPNNSDPATMIYTSGTTGPSKGVLLPHAYYVRWAQRAAQILGMQAGRTCYSPEPMFHSDARSCLVAALLSGGRLALSQRFSVTGFWDEVHAADASYFTYLGTMLSLLHAAPPRPDDAANPAIIATGAAAPAAIHEDFERRFGVRLVEMYGMTECILIAANTDEDRRIGSVGKPVPELDVQIVDVDDQPVAPGEIGELVLRPREPHTIMSGYWNKPEATLAAWRNLWFHTGDLMRADADGYLFYVGRLKDSIRRRGENVSAWEVEVALGRHPAVLEAAALGVPSTLGEEDVAALVVPQDGVQIDVEELHAFLSADLPRFAVPRFIEVVDSLPKTPTERVNKDLVRARGLTDAAWDAEAARSR